MLSTLAPVANSTANLFEKAPLQSEQLKVNWKKYEVTVNKLKNLIGEEGNKFDQIICIARGGMYVGDPLTRMFNKPIGVIVASSYHGQERGELNISGVACVGELGPRVLLVDDLTDSGATLGEIKQFILDYRNAKGEQTVKDVKTAVLWHKTGSKFTPDYFAETVEADVWIMQPFEMAYDKNEGIGG